jgi:hypothetical protein
MPCCSRRLYLCTVPLFRDSCISLTAALQRSLRAERRMQNSILMCPVYLLRTVLPVQHNHSCQLEAGAAHAFALHACGKRYITPSLTGRCCSKLFRS